MENERWKWWLFKWNYWFDIEILLAFWLVKCNFFFIYSIIYLWISHNAKKRFNTKNYSSFYFFYNDSFQNNILSIIWHKSFFHLFNVYNAYWYNAILYFIIIFKVKIIMPRDVLLKYFNNINGLRNGIISSDESEKYQYSTWYCFRICLSTFLILM